MSNRKAKPLPLRIISAISAFMLIGALIYVSFAGFNVVAGSMMASSVLGLGVTSVIVSEGPLDMVLGFFEALFDGVMEVVGGILDFMSSLFG